MKAEGIRKVYAEQNAEGAIYYLAEQIEKVNQLYNAMVKYGNIPLAQPEEEEGK